jgi:hypothetical protein
MFSSRTLTDRYEDWIGDWLSAVQEILDLLEELEAIPERLRYKEFRDSNLFNATKFWS